VILLPAAFTAALALLTFLSSVGQNPKVTWAFLGTTGVLGVWTAVLGVGALRSRRTLAIEVILRKQHYLQACAQGSVLLYWGWYWSPGYAMAPFILAQLLFAYAFDMLFSWSRRDNYTLGFAPFPVIFSINLFLWFKPDWFYLQFVMVALGMAAKELIRWKHERSECKPDRAQPSNNAGRSSHIFNPSSFPLAVFSLGLLLSGTTGITWGKEIASTQFYPPHMYVFIFLIGLPGQFFFGVTTMTMSAVIATYAFNLAYFAATGVYFFYDSYIPIAVFLGMHLLFNDPSTSPRTELGRIIFGTLYGLSTIMLYELLGIAGLPTFYDKLLQVPLLNLSIKAIDRIARSRWLRHFDPATLGRSWTPRQRNLAFMSVWSVVFVGIYAANGLTDSHPGQWLPFWRQACEDGRRYACPYLADMETVFCERGSGWACNEAGLMHIALSRSGEDMRRLDPTGATEPFRKGCDIGHAIACQNLQTLRTGSGKYAAVPPMLEDFPIILGGSKGEIRERDPAALYALACREGWPGTCRSAE
jgi:hypothetical protein